MALTTNTKLANRYGLNFVLYASDDTELETPLVTIDFVNVSNIELAGDRVWATGTQDHSNQIGFNNPVQGTLTISTQIMTSALLHICSGGMAGQGTSTIEFQRVPGQAPKTYILTAETVWQDDAGQVCNEIMTAHKACPRIAYNVSYTGEGDPLSMDVVFDLMEDNNHKVLTIAKTAPAILETPSISIDNGTVSVYAGDYDTTSYDVLVDDEVIDTITRT